MSTGPQTDRLETALRRSRFLDALADGPLTKPEIVAALDVSRSTVDRVVRRFERQGLVARRDGQWRLTHVGRLLATLTATYRDAAADVVEARPVLRTLPAALPVPLALVADATVLPASSPAPHRPLERVMDLLSRTTRYRGFAVALTESRFPRLFHDRVVDAGADGELVFEAPLVADVLADQAGFVGEMTAAGFRALVADDLPCGLLLLDADGGQRVAVTGYEDDGALAGVLLNDTPGALTWGRRLYRTYRSAAVDISAAFPVPGDADPTGTG